MFLWPLHFIIPAVMVLTGWLLKRRPAAAVGSSGYSTPASRRSREAWRYAQAAAPSVFMRLGALAAGVVALVDLLSLSPAFAAAGTDAVAYGAGVAALASSFFLVEHSLWERFGREDEAGTSNGESGEVRR